MHNYERRNSIPPSTRISLFIPNDVHAHITEVLERYGMSISTFFRKAAILYLEKIKKEGLDRKD